MKLRFGHILNEDETDKGRCGRRTYPRDWNYSQDGICEDCLKNLQKELYDTGWNACEDSHESDEEYL